MASATRFTWKALEMSASSSELDNVPVEVLSRFLQRERAARKEAEHLLEERSRQLYQANALLESEVQRTKAIFETAAEGILLFDEQGQIESMNSAGLQIFGLDPAAVQSMNVCDLIPSASFCHREDQCDLATRLKTMMGANSELVGQHKDGNTIPLEFVVSEFVSENRVHFSGIVRDVTRRKAMETQLAHSQKMESVGQLSAGIAHELNTPIQFVGDNTRFLKSSFQTLLSVFQSVEALLRECETGTPVSDKVESVKESFDKADFEFLKEEIPLAIDQTLQGAESVARIVKAMKVFSHPGSGEFQEIDLNLALESTLTISRSEWKYCAEVETDFSEDLPHILCQPGELNQAFLNLIVNAAHAMASKKAAELGRLTVRTKPNGNSVIVEIQDTGTGIPVSIQNRVFDPFFTTKGVGKGTGQGLAICYHVVVEIHKGKLSFESTEGVGTTFRVEIPIDPRVLSTNQEKRA